MIKNILIILLLSIPLTSNNVIIKSKINSFTSNSRNIYIVNDNTITQYDYSGNKQQHYSENKYGKISFVDASDPFRILVFFKDFNQIIFLDNQLSQINAPIYLDDFQVNEVPVVCNSNSGGFWIYNQQTTELEKYNNRLELVQKGTQMSAILQRNETPDYLTEYQNKLYLAFKQKGVYVFDIFANYIKFIPFNYKQNIQIVNNYIFYDNDSLYRYNMKNFNIKALIPFKEFKNFRIEKNTLLLANDSVIVKQII